MIPYASNIKKMYIRLLLQRKLKEKEAARKKQRMQRRLEKWMAELDRLGVDYAK